MSNFPSSIETEVLLLGALLLNNNLYDEIEDIIKEETFYQKIHGKIFSSIAKLLKREVIANHITVASFLDTKEEKDYIIELIENAGLILDIVSIARHLDELYLKRCLIEIANKMVSSINNDLEGSILDHMEYAERELFNLSCRGGMNSKKALLFSTVNASILETIRTNMNSSTFLQGMSTGFSGLDKLLSGFQKSDLLILAARPSMGKTALAVNFAVNVAKNLEKNDKGAVGFFSLEMSADQLGMRILSMESSINASLLRTGKLKESELLSIMEYSKRIQNLPLYIDDTPSISIQYVRSSIRKMVSQFNVKLVIIDYLQLLRSGRSDGNRVQEITEITQGLKAIAKECNIPVLALSQLSRLVEQRDDKKPLLSDLRESGSIEQDSDIVMFLYREEYYKARLQPDAGNTEKHQVWQSEMDKLRNKAEVIIAKHRNGPIGNINLNFDLNSTKFNNYTPYQSHSNQDNKQQ